MKYILANKFKALSLMLVLASILIRFYALPFSNSDMNNYNLNWYNTLAENGVLSTLGTNFTNYSPPYTYLLALASLTKNFIPPLISLKLISTFFDIFGMYLVFKTARGKYPAGDFPYLAASLYFSAPTVILNSSYWGQVDSFYTSFLLLCLYYLLINKYAFSMIAFGVSFSVKAQAVFFIPFLLILFLRKKIPWSFAIIPPLVYIFAIAPVVLLGRDFSETLLVYINQVDSYKVLSANSPNFYIFFSKDSYSIILPIGLVIAISAILFWVYSSYNAKYEMSIDKIILLAVLSTSITPFLLPKMHDRYFYPTDVLSILLVFFMSRLWIIPLLSQVVSFGAISVFLFGAGDHFLLAAALLNTISITLLLKEQKERGMFLGQANLRSLFERISKYSLVIITPIILFGAAISIVATSTFYRVENKVLNAINRQAQYGTQETNDKVEKIYHYINNHIEIESLYRKNPDTNTPTLSKYEAYYLQDIKAYWSKIMKVWDLSLLTGYLLCLLAWAFDTLMPLRQGVKTGGFLTIVAGTIFAAIWWLGVNLHFPLPSKELGPILNDLFTKNIFLGAVGFIFIFMLSAGVILFSGIKTSKQ